MNVEDDLRSGRCPLQVAPDPNPKLVDVCVFTIIRRDRHRVGDGQQLGESKEVQSSVLLSESRSLGSAECHVWRAAVLLNAAHKPDVVPSVERRVLEPASRAPRLQEAACPQTA